MIKTEACLRHDKRTAEIEKYRNPNKPRSAMELKFAELFNMQLPRDFERSWQNQHLECYVYVTLADVASRWYVSHPAATLSDICRLCICGA